MGYNHVGCWGATVRGVAVLGCRVGLPCLGGVPRVGCDRAMLGCNRGGGAVGVAAWGAVLPCWVAVLRWRAVCGRATVLCWAATAVGARWGLQRGARCWRAGLPCCGGNGARCLGCSALGGVPCWVRPRYVGLQPRWGRGGGCSVVRGGGARCCRAAVACRVLGATVLCWDATAVRLQWQRRAVLGLVRRVGAAARQHHAVRLGAGGGAGRSPFLRA